MKRTITLYLSMLGMALGTATAQPTITANNIPMGGDSYTFYMVDSTVIPGSGGQGTTWDFTGVNPTSTLTGTFAACPGGAGCANFPGSTLVLSFSNNTREYYMGSATAYANSGSDSGSLQLAYTDPEDIVRFPASFNSAHQDFFQATYQVGSQGYIRDGDMSAQADGWGTLILPTGTFTNVLRIHYTETYRDSAIGVSGYVESFTDNYIWFSPTHRGPLAVITSVSPAGAPAENRAYYTNAIPTGVDDVTGQQQDGILLYPNPVESASRLYLSIASPARTSATITITDINGRITEPQEINQYGNNYILNVENLPKGLYVVRIENGTQVVSRKFERQ